MRQSYLAFHVVRLVVLVITVPKLTWGKTTVTDTAGDDDFLNIELEHRGTTEPSHDAVTGNYEIKSGNRFYSGPDKDSESCFESTRKTNSKHPDVELDCPSMIEKYGYIFDELKVTTEDGYILTMFRIKGGRMSPPRPGKKAVLLMHGFVGNCMTWLFLPGNKTLAFKLADAGYEVYLGNARGTSYSQKHQTLKTTSDEYWNFSFEEIGHYDIPAMIDRILKITEQRDIYYVGYSVGTTFYLIALSNRPEYGDKIRVGFLLAPSGIIKGMTNPGFLAMFGLGSTDLEVWKREYGNSIGEKNLNRALILGPEKCSVLLTRCGLCKSAAYSTFGYNPKQMDGSIVHFFSSEYLDTTSTKLFCHVSQVFKSGNIAKFDYREKNQKMYGSTLPPKLPLERLAAPTVAFWAVKDNVSPPEGTKQTLRLLSTGVLVENNRVQDNSFHHVDFLTAKDVNRLIYDRILYIMDKGMYVKNKSLTIETSTMGVSRMHTNNSATGDKNSGIVTENPIGGSKNPVGVTQKSAIVSEKSVISTEKSVISTEKSVISTEKSVISTEKSGVVTENPFVATEKPFSTTEKPFAATEKQFSATLKSSVATETTFSTTLKPFVATEKSVGATNKPFVATEKPTISTKKSVAAKRPTVTSQKQITPTKQLVKETKTKTSATVQPVTSNETAANSTEAEGTFSVIEQPVSAIGNTVFELGNTVIGVSGTETPMIETTTMDPFEIMWYNVTADETA